MSWRNPNKQEWRHSNVGQYGNTFVEYKIICQILYYDSFPSFKPSIAFLILDDNNKTNDLRELIGRVNKFQNTFKDCNVLIIGTLSDQFWNVVQNSISAGRLNFIFAENELKGATEIRTYLSVSNDTAKSKIQLDYFVQVWQLLYRHFKASLNAVFVNANILYQRQQSLTSSEEACKILKETFYRINIDAADSSIMQDMYPSISSSFTTLSLDIGRNCPVGEDVPEKIEAFFGGSPNC